jgi:hypothetical protein
MRIITWTRAVSSDCAGAQRDLGSRRRTPAWILLDRHRCIHRRQAECEHRLGADEHGATDPGDPRRRRAPPCDSYFCVSSPFRKEGKKRGEHVSTWTTAPTGTGRRCLRTSSTRMEGDLALLCVNLLDSGGAAPTTSSTGLAAARHSDCSWEHAPAQSICTTLPSARRRSRWRRRRALRPGRVFSYQPRDGTQKINFFRSDRGTWTTKQLVRW